MTKLGIVVDSTTILNDDTIKKYNIKKASLNVLVGEREFKEVDITPEQMVEFMDMDKTFKTSQPSPQLFVDAYQELLDEGYEDIFVFPLSKNISGTFQSANIAKDIIGYDRIIIFDSLICNYALENLVLAILPMIDEDKSIEEIKMKTLSLMSNSDVIFFISDLHHLFKGGRLSRLSLAIGTLLRIKPIIMMADGKLNLVKKVRTHNAVMEFFLEQLDKFKKFTEVYIRVVYLQNEDIVKELIELIKEKIKCKITITTAIGPVFHCHLGNNGYGIAIVAS